MFILCIGTGCGEFVSIALRTVGNAWFLLYVGHVCSGSEGNITNGAEDKLVVVEYEFKWWTDQENLQINSIFNVFGFFIDLNTFTAGLQRVLTLRLHRKLIRKSIAKVFDLLDNQALSPVRIWQEFDVITEHKSLKQVPETSPWNLSSIHQDRILLLSKSSSWPEYHCLNWHV